MSPSKKQNLFPDPILFYKQIRKSKVVCVVLIIMAKIDNLRACRNCGVVFSRLAGMKVVSKCPNCESAIAPDNIEI